MLLKSEKDLKHSKPRRLFTYLTKRSSVRKNLGFFFLSSFEYNQTSSSTNLCGLLKDKENAIHLGSKNFPGPLILCLGLRDTPAPPLPDPVQRSSFPRVLRGRTLRGRACPRHPQNCSLAQTSTPKEKSELQVWQKNLHSYWTVIRNLSHSYILEERNRISQRNAWRNQFLKTEIVTLNLGNLISCFQMDMMLCFAGHT